MESVDYTLYEKNLNDTNFLGGHFPSDVDTDLFSKLKESPPSVEEYPNLFAWYCLVSKFSDSAKSSWQINNPKEKKVNLKNENKNQPK